MKCLICQDWIIKRAAMYCPKHLATYGDALPWEARA